MLTPCREVPTEDSARTEERHVYHTEEYREQGRQYRWLAGIAHERWI